jgi:pyruvate ferredoxin oxidoreductase gamma subunit
MDKLVEVRWHGRGGQGAKTAALLLADVAFETGRYVQGFPEYGPERMGAPITAYNRIAEEKIRVHSNIYDPNFVVVIDDTLIQPAQVAKGIKEGGAILINSKKSREEIQGLLGDYAGTFVVIDAERISVETIGKNFPNIPMLSALVKIAGIMDETEFVNGIEASFQHKFSSKPEVIAGNMAAVKQTLKEVTA